MHLKFERGALNLIGVAFFSGLFACVAIAALFSWRNERNLFAEGWIGFGHIFQQAQHAAGDVYGANTTVLYKCTVNGIVLYSNVACDVKHPARKKVDWQDTRGFEAPKAPHAAASGDHNATSLQDKMIDKEQQGR